MREIISACVNHPIQLSYAIAVVGLMSLVIHVAIVDGHKPQPMRSAAYD